MIFLLPEVVLQAGMEHLKGRVWYFSCLLYNGKEETRSHVSQVLYKLNGALCVQHRELHT